MRILNLVEIWVDVSLKGVQIWQFFYDTSPRLFDVLMPYLPFLSLTVHMF